MPGGSLDPDDSAREQQCEHCGLWFALNGIHNHRSNCLLKDVDATVQSPGADDPSDGVPDASEDDAPDTPEPTDSGPTPARADGGKPMEPPTPSGVVQEPDAADDGDVPDHFVPVDEWIERVERKNPRLAETDDWARICAGAENCEHVDLSKTDLENGQVELV